MSRPRPPDGGGWQKVAEVSMADMLAAMDRSRDRRPAIERLRRQTGLSLEAIARLVWNLNRRPEGTIR